MRMAKQAREKGSPRSSSKLLNARKLRNVPDLRDAIARSGYLDQRPLGMRPFRCRPSGGVLAYNEKRVAISRDGRPLLLHLNANDRLAIAKIVGVQIVPVWVQGVHREWVKYAVKKHRTHPLRAINLELAAMDVRDWHQIDHDPEQFPADRTKERA